MTRGILQFIRIVRKGLYLHAQKLQPLHEIKATDQNKRLMFPVFTLYKDKW